MTRIFLPCASLVFTACTAHVTGGVQIDGAPFVATTCRSGQASGFSGVDLADDQGRRLRLAQSLDGSFVGVYFPLATRSETIWAGVEPSLFMEAPVS